MTKQILAALAALVMVASQAMAANTKSQKADTEEPAPACTSYQLDQNGNWAPLPCHEVGSNSSSQHRTSQKSHDHEER